MSLVARRRRTRATYVGHGVVIGRVEDEARLWYGMKDRPAVVVPERGALEFLYRGRTYQQRPGVLQLKKPGEIYRDLRRDGPATYRVVLFDPAVVAAASAASAGELVFDHVGVDKYHLIRAFRAQVGVPPYEFLTHARVHRARELLRRGVLAASAATAVGFCDQSQLHRHFVRLVGMTPGRYAARARSSLRSSITPRFERSRERGQEHGIVRDRTNGAAAVTGDPSTR